MKRTESNMPSGFSRRGLFVAGVLFITAILLLLGTTCPGEWEPTRVLLSVNVLGNGTVGLSPSGGMYFKGEDVTLTATADPGWHFARWEGAAAGMANPAIITMDTSKTVGAVFEQDAVKYTLTMSVTGEGIVSPSGGGQYDPGEVVTLKAAPKAGSLFLRWEGDVNDTSGITTVTMDSDKTVTAVFASDTCTLTVKTYGGGSVSPAGGEYQRGDKVTLTATPDAGSSYEFIRWEGDASGTSPSVTVTMDSDKIVYAVFSAKYELTVNITGTGEGTVTPSGGEYVEGTKVTLQAVAAAGSHFVRWEGRGVGGIETPTVEITMDDHRVITAVIDKDTAQYTLTAGTQGLGTVALNPPGGVYQKDTVVTLIATPSSGWRFSRWEGDSLSLINEIMLTMDRDKSVIAVFEQMPTPSQFTLTVNVQGQGSVALSPAGGAYDADTVVTLTATPAADWRFDRWEQDITGSDNPATITMDADKTVDAFFVQVGAGQFAFYAIYDRIADTDSLQKSPWGHALLSRDGSTLAFTTSDGSLYVTNPANPVLTAYDVSSLYNVEGLTMTQDGSRIFVAGGPDDWKTDPHPLLKIEGGTVSKIDMPSEFVGEHKVPARLQATASGDYLYFADSYDVYRMRPDGTGFEKVINDSEVPSTHGDSPWDVGEFCISGDGGVIVFDIERYWDGGGHWHTHEEVFALQGGSYTQLTDDTENKSKSGLLISPDGSTIVFKSETKWYTINPDGSGLAALSDLPDSGTVVCNDDGTTLMHYDGLRLQGGSILDILPYGLNAHYSPSMNGEGDRIAFIYRYQSLPTNKYAICVGYLNQPDAVPDAPSIQSITFSPPTMSRSASSPVILNATVADTDGLSDVTSVTTWELSGGEFLSRNVFDISARDDGVAPDTVAGDGIYACDGSANSDLAGLSQVTVRVEAYDASKTTTLADTVLSISD